MTSDLFRREAVDHATRRLDGEVVVATPLKVSILGALLVGVVAVAGAFATTASYARKESVVGWLTPEAGLVRAAAQRGGIATEVLVEEGATVAAGAPLAVMRLSADTVAGDAGEALLRALTAQAEAAEARARAAAASLVAEGERLRGERAGLVEELAAIADQISFQERRVTLTVAETGRGEEMAARGILPRAELDRRRTAELEARQDLAALRGAMTSLQRDIDALDARVAAIPIDRAAAEAEAAAARAALAERTTQARVADQYVVVSPIAGRVAAIPVQPGRSLVPGETVAVVTPADGHLVAELYVPSRAAGFIQPEQDVRLMYEAFPHQRFGVGAARVQTVSRTVLAPSEVAIPGVALQEPVFRVRAVLERETVDAYGAPIPLQPGMLLHADVVIDQRSLLEWLFDPIFAARRR
jgi:membrane fusion protein